MANDKSLKKADKKLSDDSDKLFRDQMKIEMLKKINQKINEGDKNFMKALRAYLIEDDEETK